MVSKGAMTSNATQCGHGMEGAYHGGEDTHAGFFGHGRLGKIEFANVSIARIAQVDVGFSITRLFQGGSILGLLYLLVILGQVVNLHERHVDDGSDQHESVPSRDKDAGGHETGFDGGVCVHSILWNSVR